MDGNAGRDDRDAVEFLVDYQDETLAGRYVALLDTARLNRPSVVTN